MNKPKPNWEIKFDDQYLPDRKFKDSPEYAESVKLLEEIKQFIRETRKEAKLEGYKQGVLDEIECVETSGEHINLQQKLKKQIGDLQ